MRVAVIVNPISGPRRRRRRARDETARRWFASRSIDVEIAVTTHDEHAADLARRFVHQGVTRIIAWGGDGTLNEVAGPLIGTDVVLGLIPGGSGNGLARGLGVPTDPDLALSIATGESVTRLDVGWVGDRHFLNVAGFGFDAAVAQAFHRRPGRGFVSYLLSSVHCLRQYRSNTYSMELDREPRSGEYFLVAFANGREYGNGFALAQNADPSDGWLDSVLVEPASMLRQVWRMRSMLSASERPVEGIARRRVRSARLSGTGLLAHVDGEWFQPPDTVHIRVEAGALLLAAATTPAAEG